MKKLWGAKSNLYSSECQILLRAEPVFELPKESGVGPFN